MAMVDSLLKLLVDNGGDEVVLVAGQSPSFLSRGQPIKLFLRALRPERHAMVASEVGDRDTWEAGDLGTFHVQVSGPEHERIRLFLPGALQSEGTSADAGDAVDASPEPDADALGHLLDYAAEVGASDLHLATGEPAVLRVDGKLQPLGRGVQDVDTLLTPLLSDADRATLAAGRRGGSLRSVRLRDPVPRQRLPLRRRSRGCVPRPCDPRPPPCRS